MSHSESCLEEECHKGRRIKCEQAEEMVDVTGVDTKEAHWSKASLTDDGEMSPTEFGGKWKDEGQVCSHSRWMDRARSVHRLHLGIWVRSEPRLLPPVCLARRVYLRRTASLIVESCWFSNISLFLR